MGVTKTNLFTDEQNKIASYAKAFAHPARVAIIHKLKELNACYNGDLVAELGLAQATISQHLKELKAIGVIQGTISGTSVSYCLNPIVWKELNEVMNNLFSADVGSNSDGCC